MASGEHVVEDLFGFAELTGEAVPPATDATGKKQLIVDKKSEDLQKFHFEKEKIKRDTDEVVIPIFFEKSGVKKYKVLARHQVDDDEDIKRPNRSERQSPNSEEQRKENINIVHKSENVQKQKGQITGNVKRPKVNRIEEGKEHSIRNLKLNLNTRKFKGKINKKQHNRKPDENMSKNIEQKEEKMECSNYKDPRAMKYEFRDDSDDTELCKVKTKVQEVVNFEEVKECNTSISLVEDRCKTINVDTENIPQNPLKIKCHVKLRRDPSIENFYKSKSENDSKISNCLEISNSGSKTDERNAKVRDECIKEASSTESKAVCSQNSSEESLIKATNMVYNVDIQVRKSGRLKSAKCASRYRGDYGIRVDTYKQLMSKNVNIEGSGNSGSKIDGKKTETEIVEGNMNTACEKHLETEKVVLEVYKNERLSDSVDTAQSEKEHKEGKEGLVACNERIDIPDKTCKMVSSVEEFTVIKEPVADNAGSEIVERNEQCSETQHMQRCIEVNNDEGIEMKYQTDFVVETKTRTDLNLSNCNTVAHEQDEVCEMKICENKDEGTEINENSKCGMEELECKQEEKSEIIDKCSYKIGKDMLRSFIESDDKVTETECSNVTSEVPCPNVIKGDLPCVYDKATENTTFDSVRKASIGLTGDDKSRTVNLLSASTETIDAVTISDSYGTKEKINETLQLLQSSKNGSYVHSVGKSVNKIQKRIKTKKIVSDLRSENADNEITTEISPVKDPAKVLETLRQKLFESAGADLAEADKVPKQFESKLISSKQRLTIDSQSATVLDLQEKDRQVRDSDSASGRSGKSTPRCSTPRQESGREILEEVAKSLNVLHQAKRRSENSSKIGHSKRPRFGEKTFLLRSMMKKSDGADKTKTSKWQQDTMVEGEKLNKLLIKAGRIAERTRSSRSSGESCNSKTETCKMNRKVNIETRDFKTERTDIEQEKPVPKQKPVKCSACSHIFKTKELLRKHFPCRIRQTRTWSQNKLRPNRAVKRIESGSKMFVCKLPKVGKQEPSKPRPQLLTYRKTKFRRVKGKRRRKLYQLIQELKQRRMPIKWHHLSVVYDDLSFKEQCLYKLGLICVGHASEGLERYTAEEITIFEQHRAKEKWLTEDAQTFEHSTPDPSEPLTDLNVSTELSTDNQESDFYSPKHVILFPQENIKNKICDTEKTIQEDKDEGAINKISLVEIYENGMKDVTDVSPFSNSTERRVPCQHVFYPGLDEKEMDRSYEEIVDLSEMPEKFNADVTVEEYLEYFRNSASNSNRCEIQLVNDAMKSVAISPRSQNIAQLETLTKNEESTECLEDTQELSQNVNLLISVKGNLVDNPLRRVTVSEINVRTANITQANETNQNESSNITSGNEFTDVNKQDFMNDRSLLEKNRANSGNDLFSIKNQVENDASLSYEHNKDHELDFKLNCKDLEIESSNVQETLHQDFPTIRVISSVIPDILSTVAVKDIEKKVPASCNKQALAGKGLEGAVDKTVCNVEIREGIRKSPRKKFIVAPDIELYHQTATIDDHLLDAVPLAIHNKSTSEKGTVFFPSSNKINTQQPKEEEIKESNYDTAAKLESGFSSDLIPQASGILKDNAGDVEQTVSHRRDTVFEEVEGSSNDNIESDHACVNNSAVIKKNTNVNVNISPVKGILKNADLRKEYSTLPPDKSNRGLPHVKLSDKSPGKRKIDFKTYAKRKGMMKEKDENDKECIQSEPVPLIEDTKQKAYGKEENICDKECMRSDSHHEIEDDLLGRLLDAVNLIDSIIEEHKDQSEPERVDGCFSAITPEMAFEAAVSNKGIKITDMDAVSKPYDIESLFPCSEVEKDLIGEKSYSTGFRDLSEVSETVDFDLTNAVKIPVYSSSEKNSLPGIELACVSSSQNVFQATISDTNKINESFSVQKLHFGNAAAEEKLEREYILTMKESSVYHEKEFQKTTKESKFEITSSGTGSKESGNIKIVSLNSYEDSKEEELETDLNENITDLEMVDNIVRTEMLLSEKMKSAAGDDTFLENIEQQIRKSDNDTLHETLTINDKYSEKFAPEKICMEEKDEHNTDEMIKKPEHIPYIEQQIGKSDNDTIHESLTIKDIFSEKFAHEKICMEKKDEHNTDEIMKSPEHIPKKRSKISNGAPTIKESKRDFTIKYEMNGILIKENLLTGDKNVVENSSPFRSSAESDSNFDQLSVSESDVSLVPDNEISFDSSVAVGEHDNAENSSCISKIVESDSLLNDIAENETMLIKNIEDRCIHSDGDTVSDRVQAVKTNEEDTVEISHELDIRKMVENNMEKWVPNIDIQKAVEDTRLVSENITDICVEEENLDACENFEEEMAARNVPCLEMEPLLDTDDHVLRKISDDHSVGSPPVLEKVEVTKCSTEELHEEICSRETVHSSDVDPPILEPQKLEEGDKEHDKHKVLHPVKQERHFLDILGIVAKETSDSAIFSDLENKNEALDVSGSKRSQKPLLEELYSEDSTLNDSIGRHFSDVASETVEAPRTPKSKLQFLFDKSERGDVTLAQIKDILSPISKKGKKKFIPKESLLKIKSGIADLLSNVKKPVKKDPSWLKRNAFSDYTKKNIKKKPKNRGEKSDVLESSSDESISDKEEIMYISSDSLESTDLSTDKDNLDIENKIPSKRLVADAIMQMLDTLEDKGSVAENMSNLLDILAENLGFLSKGKADEHVEDLSSDSDYSYKETRLTNNSSTENTQKELIRDYLEEGEQPPSLDDIPTASNFEFSWKKDVTEVIKDGERLVDTENRIVDVDQQLFFKNSESMTNSLLEKNGQEQHSEDDISLHSLLEKNGLEQQSKDDISLHTIFKNKVEIFSKKTEHGSEEDIKDTHRTVLNFEDSDGSLAGTTDHTKDDKCKATTIFKSITELNSIETDEESNTDESFDHVSMSARLSELKVLTKQNNTWEFNSDYNSDEEQVDNFELEFQNYFENSQEHACTEESNLVLAVESEKLRDITEIHSPRTDFLNQDNQKYDIKTKEMTTLYEENTSAAELLQVKFLSNESSDSVFNEIDGKADDTEETEREHLLPSKIKQDVNKSNSSHVLCRNEVQVSLSSVIDVNADSDNEDASEVKLLPVVNITATENMSDKSKQSSPKFSIDILHSEKRCLNFIEKVDEAVQSYSPKAETQNILNDKYESDMYDEYVDSLSLKALKDPDSDFEVENDLSEAEDWQDVCKFERAIEIKSNIKNSVDVYESKEMAGHKLKTPLRMPEEETELTTNKKSFKTDDQCDDLRLIFEVEDFHNKPEMIKTAESVLVDLDKEELEGKNVHNDYSHTEKFMSNSCYGTHESAEDEDTNETVTYDEHDEAKIVFSGALNKDTIEKDIDEANYTSKPTDDQKDAFPNSLEASQNLADETDNEQISSEKNKASSQVKQEYESRETDTLDKTQNYCTPEVGHGRSEHLAKSSTLLNVEKDLAGNFCESIAEKVKRKQRERSKSVCYNFNPWLYYSAAYVREVTKPTKKEISIFRSSILEKRAREKSFLPEKDVGCSSGKKRYSSIPKESRFETDDEKAPLDERSIPQESGPKLHVKPCRVVIPKLTEDTIQKYTNKKRKLDEDIAEENRPPIKVTIKLSQIIYPPNSPYGSTSTSSDNYRSGYESCSEESEDDVNEQDEENDLETEKEEQSILKICKADNDNVATDGDESDMKTGVSNREPLKIKMRTLITKMNSCEEDQDAPKYIQEIDSLNYFSRSLNESSNETNVEVSTGELIESEVLHDIKRECEKVKSKVNDVVFYLSGSDDENEVNSSKLQSRQLEKTETENSESLGNRVLSNCSIKAECGESDVDLSDSDTDSEIQEEIDKILNSKSSSDFSSGIVLDDNSQKIKKGRSSLMKLIVSDLRLSESESEPEFECNIKTEEKAYGEVSMKVKKDCIEQSNDTGEVAKQEMNESINLNITENGSEFKIAEKDITQNSKSNNAYSWISEILDNSVQKSNLTSPKDKDSIPLQNKACSPVHEYFTDLDKDFICTEQGDMSIVTDNVITPLDFSVTTKKTIVSSSLIDNEITGFPIEETKPILYDLDEKKNPDQNQRLPSGLRIIKRNKSLDSQSFYNNDMMTSSPSGQEKTINGFAQSGKNESSKPVNEVLTNSLNKYEGTDKATEDLVKADNETWLSSHCKSINAPAQDESLKNQVYDAGQVSSNNVSNGKDLFQVKNTEAGTCNVSAGSEACFSVNVHDNVLENTVISEEETKQLENVSAVKNLEGDIFQDVQPIQDSTQGDMVYYAVELSDDLETNEAVVNLETVELIEGPIIIENNDTHEENILDTNIIQSHVNDQYELSNEALNEQIVETLNETKFPSEVRINSALESVTQHENPVYYPTVSAVKSKYLYGISEDSQSSNEVVEELVTDVVNDSSVIQDVDENSHLFSEVSAVGSPIIKENFANVIPVSTENSKSISENPCQKQKFSHFVEVNVESSQKIFENSNNTEKFTEVQKFVSKQNVSEVTDEDRIDMDTSVSMESDMKFVNDSVDIGCTSYTDYVKLSDRNNKSLSLNISENNADTREMCSLQDSLIQFKADNLSGGLETNNETVFKQSGDTDQNRMYVESSDVDKYRMCVESSDIGQNELCAESSVVDQYTMCVESSDVDQDKIGIESSDIQQRRMCIESSDVHQNGSECVKRGDRSESNITIESMENDFVQGYDNFAMVIECNDDNDYIITKNENFDEEEDEEEELDAMEIV